MGSTSLCFYWRIFTLKPSTAAPPFGLGLRGIRSCFFYCFPIPLTDVDCSKDNVENPIHKGLYAPGLRFGKFLIYQHLPTEYVFRHIRNSPIHLFQFQGNCVLIQGSRVGEDWVCFLLSFCWLAISREDAVGWWWRPWWWWPLFPLAEFPLFSLRRGLK